MNPALKPSEHPASAVKITVLDDKTAIRNCEVYISQDGQQWTLVKAGNLSYSDKTAVSYFNGDCDSGLEKKDI